MVAFGTQVIGLSLGAAVVLGAILAPTDPVLAGDIGVGPPGDEDEHEPNFSVTGEAGLNDGLALPFLFLGLFIVAEDGGGWFGEWLAADVIYGIGAGLAIGAAIGYGLGGLAVWLRERELLATAFDAWLAIPSVLLIYAVTEIAGAFGFIAAFAGGLAYRRYEGTHETNLAIHDGAEVVEKFGELVFILLLGSMLSLDGLGVARGRRLAPGPRAALGDPAAVGGRSRCCAATCRPASERSSPGSGCAASARSITPRSLSAPECSAPAEGELIAWTAIACVGVSIVVHGVTASSLSRRWLPPEALERSD